MAGHLKLLDKFNKWLKIGKRSKLRRTTDPFSYNLCRLKMDEYLKYTITGSDIDKVNQSYEDMMDNIDALRITTSHRFVLDDEDMTMAELEDLARFLISIGYQVSDYAIYKKDRAYYIWKEELATDTSPSADYEYFMSHLIILWNPKYASGYAL